MKTFFVFVKKECMELLRTGKLTVLLIIFILFGIMNPAIAKLTPWLMEAMADTLAESGMLVSGITVDAMSSWTQFYKNIPMALAIFIFITGNAFIKEYQSGTLVQMLTGGLTRGKVFASKTLVISCMWSVCYWLCFFITYAYNAYFWDNGAALNLFFSAFCFYLFGLLIVSLTVLMSVCFSSAGAVFAGTGGIVVCVYFLNTVPVIARYLPARLTDSMKLLTGALYAYDCYTAVGIAAVLIILVLAVAFKLFKLKKL